MDAVHKGGDKHILVCAHHYRTQKLFHYPRSPLCSFDSSTHSPLQSYKPVSRFTFSECCIMQCGVFKDSATALSVCRVPSFSCLDSSSLPRIDAEVTDLYPPSKVLGMKPQSWLNCQELTYAPRQGLLPGGPASLHAELNSAPGHLGLGKQGFHCYWENPVSWSRKIRRQNKS